MKSLLISIGQFLVKHYDRLLALIVLIALGYAVMAYVLGLRATDQRRADFKTWLVELEPPLYPTNDVVDLGPFDRALVVLKDPIQIKDVETRVFTPELRVTCQECRWPKPYNALSCPHCGFRTETNRPIIADVDLDGMDDKWEKKYGLNPRLPEDANRDADDDGFTNLEEHNAKPQTIPIDVRSHPPLLDKICLAGVRRFRFPLQFKAVTDWGAHKEFQLNHVNKRRTYLVKLGDVEFGYKVVKYEPKKVMREQSGMMIEVDVSILTLEKDGEQIPLVKDTESQHFLYMAKIRFSIDDSEYSAREGGEFTLKGPKYKGYKFKVKGIDSKEGSVVIEDLQTTHSGRIQEW